MFHVADKAMTSSLLTCIEFPVSTVDIVASFAQPIKIVAVERYL